MKNGTKTNTTTATNENSIGIKVLVEKLSSITVDQLDELARTGNTRMASGAFAPDFTPPKAKGNWKYQLVVASKDGAQKVLVLLPNDHRTRGIWRKGQEAMAIAAGLSKELAYVWAGSSVNRRHDTLPMLVTVMKDPRMQEAYIAFADGDAKAKGGVNVKEWSAKASFRDQLGYTTRVCLGRIVKELVEHIKASEEEARKAQVLNVNPLLMGFIGGAAADTIASAEEPVVETPAPVEELTFTEETNSAVEQVFAPVPITVEDLANGHGNIIDRLVGDVSDEVSVIPSPAPQQPGIAEDDGDIPSPAAVDSVVAVGGGMLEGTDQ